METPDLKSADDDALEALLRTPARALPDEGFSLRVVAALPPRRQSRDRLRLLVCGVGALIGGAVAVAKIAAAGDHAVHGPDYSLALANLSEPRVPLGVAVAVATLLILFWRSVRDHLRV